ncbi:hypothetical protein MAR_033512 [Mya arenaria]|uniref:Uncharacterized protein n=1 Tax=Mya arenaria TaxID=6604 RepID=A0ABY7G985_MYAAR|nr:hypothetical protein MAR_033512 [Mya arenaria]
MVQITDDIAVGIVTSSVIECGSHSNDSNASAEVLLETSSAPCRNGQTRGKHQLCLSNCMRGFGYVVKAFCGAIGTCVCQCANRLLLNLFLPLCSMSIAISSVVLPYWAWGEEDKVAVGLFKCCKFTEKDVNDCSPLSNCVPSDSTTIGYIGIIVFLSGVIQSESLTRFPLRLSIHLAMISCAVNMSYAFCLESLRYLYVYPFRLPCCI